ncbi:MAG: hypothetical protein ABIJ96_13560 [Elusimicrobiota bacterium]
MPEAETPCPHCASATPAGAAECPQCGLIFAKLKTRAEQPPPAPVVETERFPQHLKIAADLAATVALFFTWNFRDYLPMPQGWASLQKLWFPLSFLNLALHEGGHIIFGLPGNQFLTIAGGTLMELLMPAACLFHFMRQKSMAGVGFAVFWLGTAFVDVAFYAADAKLQALILITGKSGQEGSAHDWVFMLRELGLKDSCVGIGQIFFFLGCLAMAFPFLWAAAAAWEHRRKR